MRYLTGPLPKITYSIMGLEYDARLTPRRAVFAISIFIIGEAYPHGTP